MVIIKKASFRKGNSGMSLTTEEVQVYKDVEINNPVEDYLYYGNIKNICIKDGILKIEFNWFVEAVSVPSAETGSSSAGLGEPGIDGHILDYSSSISDTFVKKENNTMILTMPDLGDILIFFKDRKFHTLRMLIMAEKG